MFVVLPSSSLIISKTHQRFESNIIRSDFKMDWLRSGSNGAVSDAWYVSQDHISTGVTILCDVDFPRQRVQIAVRGSGIVVRRRFDPETQAPLWPCWAIRPTTGQVTLVRATAREIDSLQLLNPDQEPDAPELERMTRIADKRTG